MKRTNQFFQLVMMATIFLLASCQTPEKLLKKGAYDESVVEAIKRLQKKKKNKLKDVLVVEEAFRKITRTDMEAIESLKAEGRASNWVKINNIHNDIKDRQELIAPHLPLYAKDGYKAEFSFVKINALERDSREKAAEYYYVSGLEYLEKGEAGYKYDARRAFDQFENTFRYFDNYKNAKVLKAKALELGKNYVLFNVTNETNRLLPRGFEEDLVGINVQNMNTRWTRYSTNPTGRPAFDYEITMKLRDIEVTPDLVNERRYVDEKEIKDGFDYVLDSNGNVLKDSLGNDIKTDRYINIQAWVNEVAQRKSATLHSRLVFRDGQSKEILRNENLQVTALFEHWAATFSGDRRALTNESRRRLNNNPIPFPSTEAMIYDALDNLKPAMAAKVRECATFVMR